MGSDAPSPRLTPRGVERAMSQGSSWHDEFVDAMEHPVHDIEEASSCGEDEDPAFQKQAKAGSPSMLGQGVETDGKLESRSIPAAVVVDSADSSFNSKKEDRVLPEDLAEVEHVIVTETKVVFAGRLCVDTTPTCSALDVALGRQCILPATSRINK